MTFTGTVILALFTVLQGPQEQLKRDLREALSRQEAVLKDLQDRVTALRDLKTRVDAAPTPELRSLIQEALRKLAEGVESAAAALGQDAPAPRTLVGMVKLVDEDDGTVVITLGHGHGVEEGDVFSIQRGIDIIARIRIEWTDRGQSGGKVLEKSEAPRNGDMALSKGATAFRKFPTPPVAPAVPRPPLAPNRARKPLGRVASQELRDLRRELDTVRLQVRSLSDVLMPVWRDWGLALEPAPQELRSQFSLASGLVVRKVRADSPAEKAGLQQHDLVPELTEAQLIEALKNGKPVRIYRNGRETTTP